MKESVDCHKIINNLQIRILNIQLDHLKQLNIVKLIYIDIVTSGAMMPRLSKSLNISTAIVVY